MTPRFAMPDPATRRRVVAVTELTDALRAARCSARLAGLETADFLVRELLLTVTEQIDHAVAIAERLS